MSKRNKQYLNSTGYKFVDIGSPNEFLKDIYKACNDNKVFGTIYLAKEGININLVGPADSIFNVERFFENHKIFSGIHFKHTYSDKLSFKKLKIKIKPEIISIKKNINNIAKIKKNYIEPKELQKMLDDGKEIYLLDTRNNFEINIGTFKYSKNLNIPKFEDFANKSEELKNIDGEVVMFCTGGIRCEKAQGYLVENGINSFRQLKGGIINYLIETDGKYWDGECFVFDDRITIDKELNPTYKNLCPHCQVVINSIDRKYCDCNKIL